MSDTPVLAQPGTIGHFEDIEARLLREAYARERLSLAAVGPVALTGAVLLWSQVDRTILMAWLVALLGVMVLGYFQYLRYKKVQASGAAVRTWQRIFASKSVLAGLAWALGPTLLIWQGSSELDVVLVGVLFCVCAVGMTAAAPQKVAMQGFILAVLVPPGIAALLMGGNVEQLVGITFLVGAAILIWAGRDAGNSLRTVMESQIQFQAVLDAALDAVVSTDAHGRVTAWSHRAQMLFGWAEHEVLGQELVGLVLVPESDATRQTGLARVMMRARSPSLDRRVEMLAKHKDGHLIPVEVASTSVDMGGTVVTTAFITDISERKAAQDRLALFRRVFDTSSQCIVISDATSRGLYQNRAHEQAMGYSDQEIIGKPFAHALKDEGASSTWAEVKQAIAKDGAWEGQLPFRRKDGSEFMSISHIGSIKGEKGDIQYVFNVFNDFTQELARRDELKAAKEAAVHAKEAAERANLAKSDFLSSMSHELRTPMNAVLGFGQILEFDDSLTSEQLDNVTEILRGGRHLLKLINDVLDLAKIESSSIRLSLEAVNFASLVDEAWRVLEPVGSIRGISLHRDLPVNAAVTADRGRLKQVLLNLLSNAINFNRDGGDISIQAHKVAGGRLRIEITDSGQGISAERIPMIFEAFNRRGTAQGQVGGTGIGLIITRKLIDLMNGEIGVESQLGVGTTFWIDLPLATGAASSSPGTRAGSAAGGVAGSAAGSAANRSVSGSAVSPSATTTTEPMPSDDVLANFDASLHDHSVLCIDDNPVNVKLIAQLLAKRPRIHLICAHSPGLGIQLALGRQPDLILLDINMPGMDGYQVAEVLKTYARTRSIPIIAVTANAAPRSDALGGTTGLADYLTKPLDTEKFLATVDRWLDQRNAAPDSGQSTH